MIKKAGLFFFAFLGFSFAPLAAQEVNEDGFLAISARIGWWFDTAQAPPHDFLFLPVTFTGVSSNYEIVSHLDISPELIHASQYYRGDASILAPGEVVPFSFANFELQYLATRLKFLNLSFGIKIGHYGFLSSDWKSPSFMLFLAPTINAFAFLGNKFMFSVPLEIPIGLYLSNIKEYFMLRTGLEATFDYKGYITNPLPRSLLFSVGVEYDYMKLTTLEKITRDIHYFKPFFKVSVLY